MDEDELFNPAYVEVDRILDSSKTTDPITGEETHHYLVKWRGLSYEESTWEVGADVERAKIVAYEEYSTPPDEEHRQPVARPSASRWKKMEESPVYKNGNQLREYQLEGVSWLLFNWYNK
jgi:SNF2 family DNA or RNA helicase